MVKLLDDMDDIADALEEAAFIHSMTLTQPLAGLPPEVNAVLGELADTTLAAIQDQIKAIEIARHMSEHTEPADSEAFLQALWRMLRAERICDDLLRSARARIVQTLHATPALFSLATELAATIGRINRAQKCRHQRLVVGLGVIIVDLHHFAVVAMAAVGGIFHGSATVTRCGANDTRYLVKVRFHTPEAPAGNDE